MKQLIALATEKIYSEELDDMGTLVTALIGDNGGSQLVRAYLSIRVAAQLTQPLRGADVEDTIERLQAAELHLNTPQFQAITDPFKELAEVHWMHRRLAIVKGKSAHKCAEDSYEGAVYALEHARKGPIAVETREKLKGIADKLSLLNRQIEEHELKVLKESDFPAYQSHKEELELHSSQTEIDARKTQQDLESDAELEALTAQLELSLKRLLNQESSEEDIPEPANSEASTETVDTESTTLDHYEEIVFKFTDLLAEHVPLIGDCSVLPYPKRKILYAICWVRDHYSTLGGETENETIREKCDGLMNTLNFLLTRLTTDWHEIGPEDKAAIAKLQKFDSFPDWALPLKAKYINEEKALELAVELTTQVMVDKVDLERSRHCADDNSEA